MKGYLDMIIPGIVNVVLALLLLLAAFIVAGIVRRLVSSLLNKILPERIVDRNPEFYQSMVMFTARISYIVVFLLFVPGIFTLMGVESAAAPIIKMLEDIVGFIPKIIVAVLIVYIGVMLSKLCGEIVGHLIKRSGLDESIGRVLPGERKLFSIAGFLAALVEILIIIFFTVQGFNVLNLEVFDKIGTAIIGFIPSILAASIIFILCFCLDSFVSAALVKGEHLVMAMFVKIFIYVIGIFMILSQLGIAAAIVNSAFVIIISAVAVAFAIAFGIGGREFAAKILAQIEASRKSDK